MSGIEIIEISHSVQFHESENAIFIIEKFLFVKKNGTSNISLGFINQFITIVVILMNDTIDSLGQALATKVVSKRHGWNIKSPCFSHINQALAHEGKG